MSDTVLPSSLLEMAQDDYYGAFHKTYNNVSLKLGLVKTVYEIDHEKNLSKKAPEYDVLTFEQEQDKGVTPITYRNCVALDSFGGVGDFFDFRKQNPTNSPDVKEANQDDGSYVLLLCIDGSNSKGVIVGSIPHHNRKPTLTKEKGKHMEGEYNGLRIKVNKDGELTITFKGATDTKGKPKTTTGGSQFRMEKDGSVEINDRDLDGELKAGNDIKAKDDSKAGDDYEKIRIDKPKKSVILNARADFTETIGGNSSSTIKGNTTQKMTDLLIECSGKANVSAAGVIDFKADGAFKVKGASGEFTFDDALKIQASAVNVNAQSINLGVGGSPAPILSTVVIAIGNLGVPTIGTMVGPFSNTVFIAP